MTAGYVFSLWHGRGIVLLYVRVDLEKIVPPLFFPPCFARFDVTEFRAQAAIGSRLIAESNKLAREATMIEETKDRYVDARLCSGTRAKGRADGTKKSSGEAHSGNGGIRETRARNLSGPPRTPATCLPDKNTTRNWAYSRGPPPPRLSLTIYWKNTLDTRSHCKHRASRYKFNIETAIRCLWSSRAHSSARLKCGVARG